jgi:serine/threonine-protein kinase
MSDAHLPSALSPDEARQIDLACDRFEAAWKAGQRPRPEEYLGAAGEPERSALLRQLLLLDWDYRRRAGDDPRAGEYRARFPGDPALIDDVSREMSEPPGSTRQGPDGPPAPDTPWPGVGSPGLPGAAAAGAEAGSDRYDLLQEVGSGGMGVVFRGRDRLLGRETAVKVLREAYRDNAEVRRRFIEEARVGSQLQHPAVVPVYELGWFGDRRPYFTMKLVEGRTLAALLHDRADSGRDLPRWLGVFEQVCQAMAYAHARGVVHRDLKPSNVMVGAFGEVQVMDWGFAKVLAGDASPASGADGSPPVWPTDGRNGASQSGQLMGTPAYMPPEQARGEAALINPRADVFALGAVLCEILTGQPPFAGAAAEEALRQAAAGDLEDAFARLDGCGADAELVRLAQACLDPEAERRPADAGAVAASVTAHRRAVEQRLRAAELAGVEERARAARARQRLRWGLALAASGLLTVALAAAGGLLWQRREAETAAAKAEADRRAAAAAAAAEADLDAAARDASAGEDGRAREELERAEGRLAGGGPDELRERLERLRKDLDFAAELDEARMSALEATTGGVELYWSGADAAFTRAFETRGLHVAGPGAEDARERIGRSAVRARIVTALDAWARVRRNAKRDGWEGLLGAAGRADDSGDATRRRLREALLGKETERLTALADDPGLDDWPAADVVLLADALMAVEKREAAERVLRAALVRNGGDFWLNALLSDVLLAGPLASREEAGGVMRAAIAARPHDAVNHSNFGLLLANQNRPAEAEKEYREALRLKPHYPAAHNNLGLLLAKQHRPAEAEREYREAIRLMPGLPAAHNNLGNLLAAQNKAAEAEKEYREALRLNPDFPEAHYGLGALLAARNQPAEAEKECREAIRLMPDDPEAHNNLGLLLAAQNKPAEAEREYREALRLNPDSPEAHNNLGALMADQSRPAEAEREYRKALRLKPHYPEAHNNLGNLLANQSRPAEAEKEHREALRLNPDFPEAHYNLGNLLANQSRPAEAEKEYREALRLKSDFPEAHCSLGVLLAGQGRPAEAEKEYREALRLNPDDPAAHNNLGNLLDHQGRSGEAEKEYKEALRLRPDYPEAHCNLGLLQRGQGRFREALAELRRGHELSARDPKWPYPSAAWVRDCERLVELDALLPAVLGGAAAPADAGAAFGFARACHYTRRHAAAARLSAAIMDGDPGAANDPRTALRYNAACSAARAGCGQGADAPSDDAERARLRAQALTWLRADLAWWTRAAERGNPNDRAALKAALSHWREDAELAGVRDADALDQLPEAERAEWRKLWADVDALLQKAASEK